MRSWQVHCVHFTQITLCQQTHPKSFSQKTQLLSQYLKSIISWSQRPISSKKKNKKPCSCAAMNKNQHPLGWSDWHFLLKSGQQGVAPATNPTSQRCWQCNSLHCHEAGGEGPCDTSVFRSGFPVQSWRDHHAYKWCVYI